MHMRDRKIDRHIGYSNSSLVLLNIEKLDGLK